MQPVGALYTSMDNLLSELGEVSGKINKEMAV